MATVIPFMVCTQTAIAAESEDVNSTEAVTEKKFRIVPLLSSNPTSATGAGLVSSYIYKLDPDSAPSQWMTGAQYTNTKSWSVFSFNNAYFKEDNWRSVTGLFYSHNKSQFTVDFSEMGIDIDFDQFPDLGNDVRFAVDIAFVGQRLLYRIKDDFYAGGHAAYIWQQYSDPNELGALFIRENGIENSSRGALGVDLTYDTRDTNARFYPHNADWLTFSGTAYPSALGSDETYYSTLFDLRAYRPGFNEEDVWANQLYGKYVSESAPDGGLAALGGRNVLRGFPMGKYKARYMTAFQSEYRYQFVGTKYRAVAFAGIANLAGGSQGTGTGNRDEDNGFYYSGGVGLRYAIQQKTGVDLRVDIVTTNDNERSVYIGLNQAF
jgi:hypothetical protein